MSIIGKVPSPLAQKISAIAIKTDTTSTKRKGKDIENLIESPEKFECVFIKNGDIAELRVVKTGIQDDSNIEITSGLEEGEEVIVGPYNVVTKTLKNGDKVQVKANVTNNSENND